MNGIGSNSFEDAVTPQPLFFSFLCLSEVLFYSDIQSRLDKIILYEFGHLVERHCSTCYVYLKYCFYSDIQSMVNKMIFYEFGDFMTYRVIISFDAVIMYYKFVLAFFNVPSWRVGFSIFSLKYINILTFFNKLGIMCS